MPRGNSKNTEYKIRSAGLGGYFTNNGNGTQNSIQRPKALWADIDPSFITASIACAEAVGIALLFGKSRDEYSLALGIFMGGDKNTFYFPSQDGYEAEVESFLARFCEDCQSTAQELSKGAK